MIIFVFLHFINIQNCGWLATERKTKQTLERHVKLLKTMKKNLNRFGILNIGCSQYLKFNQKYEILIRFKRS